MQQLFCGRSRRIVWQRRRSYDMIPTEKFIATVLNFKTVATGIPGYREFLKPVSTPGH